MPQTKEERLALGKARYLETIRDIPSLKFIEFVTVDDPLMFNRGGKEELLAEFSPINSPQEVTSWIKEVLRTHHIEGEYLLMYEDNSAHEAMLFPWIKVILSPNYSWVEPLWKLGTGLYFVAVDKSSFFQIIYDEPNFKAYSTVPTL